MSQTKAQLIDNLVQPITGALGSASAPTFSFTADPNTGLYSPGADQLALTTGGTGRLFIDASGRVGINTSSPTEILTVSKAEFANAFPFHIQNTQNWGWGVGLKLRQILASGGSVTDSAAIVSDWDGDNNSTLEFYTVTSSSLTEKLRITSTGRVGIGTSAPATLLHVLQNASGSTVALRVENTNNASNSDAVIEFKTVNASYAWRANRSGTRSDFEVDGSAKLSINYSGSVGIGTTAPLSQFVVSNGGAVGLEIQPTGFSSAPVIVSYNRSSPAYTQLTLDGSSNVFSISGTERARIDSSGRLLVGTSTARDRFNNVASGQDPLVQLEAAGTTAKELYMLSLTANNSSTDPNGGVSLMMARSNGTAVNSYTLVPSGNCIGRLRFQAADGTNLVEAASIGAFVDGTSGTGDMPGRLVFSTTADGASSPTERMRINNIGDIGINNTGTILAKVDIRQTSAKAALFVYKSDTGTEETMSLRHDGAAGAISRTQISFGRGDGVIVGTISCNGSATAYNTSSDYRLKENVIAVSDGITRLQLLKPSRFNFIADPDTVVDGFIAHEVQAIVPEAITGEKDAVDDDGNPIYQGIDQSKLVPLLTAALQEAVAEINALKDRVAALEGA